MNRIATWLTASAAFALIASPLAAQTDTTFSYQGSLAENGTPADGVYDIDFELWDALTGGTLVGSPVALVGVPVSSGQFSVELDFGAAAFDNSQRWIQIMVQGIVLNPRQPITRTPYSIQTRGIFVDANEHVGIGITTPLYPLHVESDTLNSIYSINTATSGLSSGGFFESRSTQGIGVFGQTTASSGLTYGVYGESDSTAGRGVYGEANATTGTTYGVRGLSQSISGRGVYGEANAATGITYGVYGISDSTLGRGVFGYTTASSGETYGVFGQTQSRTGRGVYGLASSTTGTNYGVYGQSPSSTGHGVHGFASATTGVNYGVYGYSQSTTGRGVYGEAGATSGTTYGGRFKSRGTSGRGVYGEATATSGTTYGGYFESDSTSGRGVYGYATATSGLTDGVFGLSQSTSGRGIDGWASASSGTTYGVVGQSDSTTGRGVYGKANASTGVNYGVVGHSNSSSGYDFWASGAGTNYGSNSSRRWKNNITNIDNPLDKLAALRGVYYDWDEEHGGHHDVGMIAEEVGKVLPEIVNYEDNGYDAIGMDYSKMTPLLVEAVNALRAEKDRDNATLREAHAAEIHDLRQQLSDLQQIVEQLASNQKKENHQ